MSLEDRYSTCIAQYMEAGETQESLENTFRCFANTNLEMEITNQSLHKVLFIIFCASLVFLMQAGFAMVCSGCVRKKNVQNTILKNFIDVLGSSIAFFFVGYSFAFGGDPEKTSFIGTTNFLLSEMDYDALGVDYAHWLFQFAFAATAATIVAGTLAERCQMRTYLMYSMLLTGFVYPVIVHNIWSPSGFLSVSNENPLFGVGMIDFAGSGVVHVTGGITALIATYMLGPRKGRFYDERGVKLETPENFPGHSKSLQMLGTLLLWFGWYGFNAGSAVSVDSDSNMNPVIIAKATVNTTLSASTSGIVALLFHLFLIERSTGEPVYKLSAAMNGALTGLASITGSCGFVEPWAAIVIGAISGLIYLGSEHLLQILCLDDAVDAIPVHLCGGLWGVIAVGLFSSPRGLKNYFGDDDFNHFGWFYAWGQGSGDFTLMSCQLVGLLCILAWTTLIMFPFFFTLYYFGMLRSDGLEELVGLDVSYHGYSNYQPSQGVSAQSLRKHYDLSENFNVEELQQYHKKRQSETARMQRKTQSMEYEPDYDNTDRFE